MYCAKSSKGDIRLFRIEFFCEDKRVGDALRHLLGIAIGHPVATPVINAEVEGKGEHKKIKQVSNGSMASQLMAYINKSHKETITPKETAAFLEEHGFSKASAHYTLRQCTDARFLRKTGKGTHTIYYVIRALPKPAATNGKKG